MNRHQFDLQHPAPLLGIDEVGLGAIAGPITVCGVILPEDRTTLELLEQLEARDSKQMTANSRERVASVLKENFVWYFIAEAPATAYKAGMMGRIVQDLMHEIVLEADRGPGFSTCIIDGTQDRDLIDQRFRTIAKADDLSLTVACASILAKVHRHKYMRKIAEGHPGYDFDHNMGYGTPRHIQGLKDRGPIPGIHRTEVKTVRRIIESRGLPRGESISSPAQLARSGPSFSVAPRRQSDTGRFH